MSTEFVPAAEVRPTTFAVRASDHVARGQQRGEELRTGIVSTLDAYRRYFSHLSITEAAVQSAATSSSQPPLGKTRHLIIVLRLSLFRRPVRLTPQVSSVFPKTGIG